MQFLIDKHTLKPYYSSASCVLGTEDIPRILGRAIVIEFYPNLPQYPYVAIGDKEWVPDNTDKYGSDKEPFKLVLNGSFEDSGLQKVL